MNRLFEMTQRAKRLPAAPVAALLAILFVLIGQLIGAFIYSPLLILGALPDNTSPVGKALYLLVFFAINLTPTGLLLWAWVSLYEKRPLHTLGFEKNRGLSRFVHGLFMGTIMFLAVVLLLRITGSLQIGAFTWTALGGVLLVLPGWILQGSLEELVMRGWLMPVVGLRSRPWVGVLLSSLVFAVLHLLNPGVSLLSAINLALAGLMFALVALWEGGLWTACGLHAAWNWVQGWLGFAVSGNLLKSPVLVQLSTHGSPLFTGGAFGPEGGLPNTIVNLAACLVFGWLIYRKNRKSGQ